MFLHVVCRHFVFADLRLRHNKVKVMKTYSIFTIKLILLFLCVSFYSFSQQADWIRKPKEQWPQIAMINEVWYKNGERYVHSSFEYAATGFLIDTRRGTMAATVKHVLWVAKTKSMNSVDLNDNLQRWIMHPKGNLKDSVVIDRLINTDSTEMLQGPQSTITQRDWILFTTKYVSPDIQPLIPRFSTVRVEERIWYFGCPYNDATCVMEESKVLAVEGNRIIFSFRKGANLGGASGSPVVDENGLLIGILGGSTVIRETGEGALYGITTHYLQKILTNKKPLNTPLIPMSDVLRNEITKNGINAGLKRYDKLKKQEDYFFKYEYSFEKINAVAEEFLQKNQSDWAIALFKVNLKEYRVSGTYIKLAQAYVETGNKKLAMETYEKVIKLWPDNKDALEGLKVLQEKSY